MNTLNVEHAPGQEIVPAGNRSAMEIATTRAAQEVQAAMVIAKKFPRDETAAFHRIVKACQRKSLAEVAVYEYPRGNEKVTGPSIRLAEVLAQSWGNVDSGVIELEQNPNESKVMAYCWDLETNTRDTKIFTVKHERHVGRGKDNKMVVKITDPRDIYEMSANQGARRKRACILAIIPGDVIDAAIVECEKTLAGGNKEPLSDRVRKMVGLFADYGVTPAMIEARLGHTLDAITESELVKLGRVYNSLKDGMGKREDFFDLPGAEPTPGPAKKKSDTLAENLARRGTQSPAQQSAESREGEQQAASSHPAAGAANTEPTEAEKVSIRVDEILAAARIGEAGEPLDVLGELMTIDRMSSEELMAAAQAMKLIPRTWKEYDDITPIVTTSKLLPEWRLVRSKVLIARAGAQA